MEAMQRVVMAIRLADAKVIVKGQMQTQLSIHCTMKCRKNTGNLAESAILKDKKFSSFNTNGLLCSAFPNEIAFF